MDDRRSAEARASRGRSWIAQASLSRDALLPLLGHSGDDIRPTRSLSGTGAPLLLCQNPT
jgi:hypothetical protein